METARVQRWLKDVGDNIAQGEPLVEVETEKTVVEIEAPVGGRLVEILIPPDQEVAVGTGIAWVEDGKAQTDRAANAEPAAAVSRPAREVSAAPVSSRPEGMRISPSARRLAAEYGIDASTLTGTGPGGRIQREDVEQAAARRGAGAAPAKEAGRIALTPMRRAIARAMTLSNATVPQFFVGRSIDWTSVQAVLSQHSSSFESKGLKLSVNDFLLQSVARTLMEFAALNAVFCGDPNSAEAYIQPASGAHIGLVVALPDGMLVPVLHHVEQMSLMQIAAKRAELVERAYNSKLSQDEAGGATFTLSNLGAQGPDRFTAILNPPESAILAVGRMRNAAVAVDGAPGVRPVSELNLTVDHRLADGKLAADFLARLVQILEGREWRVE